MPHSAPPRGILRSGFLPDEFLFVNLRFRGCVRFATSWNGLIVTAAAPGGAEQSTFIARGIFQNINRGYGCSCQRNVKGHRTVMLEERQKRRCKVANLFLGELLQV